MMPLRRCSWLRCVGYLLALLLACLGSATTAVAADPPSAPVSDASILESIRAKHELPGMVAAVVRDGKLVYLASCGVRKLGEDAKLETDDRMHLGSCTKAMTATLIARLVEQKKLTWNTTLGEVFTDLKPPLHESWKSVTVVDLLVHRSGASKDTAWHKYNRGKSITIEREKLLADVCSKPLPGKLREGYEYSNIGYFIAGAMAERVTGKSWEELMKTEVFEPLSISSAGFGPPGRHGAQPWGHERDGKKIKPLDVDNSPSLGPAGTVHMNLQDWARFVRAHLAGARGNSMYLSADSWQRLHTIEYPTDRYALGWGVFHRDWGNGRVLTHNGSNSLWFAVVWMAPETNFAVMVATNIADGSSSEACDEATASLIQKFAPSVANASVKVMSTLQQSDDLAVFTADGETTGVLTITSERGIGSAKIQLAAGHWPRMMKVRLKYTGDRSFHALEGFTLQTARHRIEGHAVDDRKSFSFYLLDQQGRRSNEPAGTLNIGVELGKNDLTLTLPENLLRPDESLQLDWVDRYR